MKLTRREALLMPFAAALQAKSHIPREYSEIGLPVQGPEHHRVFYTKTDGPPVVILHEITGLSRPTWTSDYASPRSISPCTCR